MKLSELKQQMLESIFIFEEHSGNYEDLSPSAKELDLHSDNTRHLHNHQQAIIANLQKKKNKGVYNPELAQKLWRYHSDAARKDYNKVHGAGSIPVSASKEHAAFLEKYHRENTLE